MPCDAPVTSATFPESALSWIAMILPCSRLLVFWRAERFDFVGLADRGGLDRVGDALDEALQHAARAELVRARDAGLREVLHRLLPAHGRGDLADEQLVNVGGQLRRLGGD